MALLTASVLNGAYELYNAPAYMPAFMYFPVAEIAISDQAEVGGELDFVHEIPKSLEK
jgi:hypothetical protein